MQWSLDWNRVFAFTVSPLEIVARGTIMYLSLFLPLRLVLKRQTGTFATADILLIVLIADASQNGMAGEYKSVSEGLLLIVTLVFWNYALDWLNNRFPWFEKLTFPKPLELVREGTMNRRNMRRELISFEELMAHLREQGVESVEGVKAAHMEGDGQISAGLKYLWLTLSVPFADPGGSTGFHVLARRSGPRALRPLEGVKPEEWSPAGAALPPLRNRAIES